jgi:PAS domain S-box-containing protein
VPDALAPLQAQPEAGAAEVAWAGARRVTGYQPAALAPAEGLFVAVGLDRDLAFAEAGHRARLALLGTVLAALAALGIALWFAVRFIRRPVAHLATAAARWEAGDLSARAGLADRSELGRLASAFDAMAAAGEAREAELRRGMARVEAEQARFRILFEAAPVAVVLIDPATLGLTAFNDMACEMLGYGREEFAGLRLSDIDAAHTEPELRTLAAVGPAPRGTLETRHRHRTGTLRDVTVTYEQVVLDGRRLAYAAWIDVTEQREAEARERLAPRGAGAAEQRDAHRARGPARHNGDAPLAESVGEVPRRVLVVGVGRRGDPYAAAERHRAERRHLARLRDEPERRLRRERRGGRRRGCHGEH